MDNRRRRTGLRLRRAGWRRLLIATAGAVLLMSRGGAYAHLTGAFADYLATIHEEETTAKLTAELERTREELAALAPQAEAQEKRFREAQREAALRLRAYADLGATTWGQLLLQPQDPVDWLGALWLAQRNAEAYVGSLDRLYAEYSDLLTTQASLAGHRQLLAAIERNLQARGHFLAENAGVEIERLANYLDIDWMSEAEAQLLQSLSEDEAAVRLGLASWARPWTDSEGRVTWRLDEAWLNERSKLRYMFRSDHIYIVFEKKDIHVILIGQMVFSGQDYRLRLEAGFFNGFLMPDTLTQELSGFTLDAASPGFPEAQAAGGGAAQVAEDSGSGAKPSVPEVRQTNGALLIGRTDVR